MSKQRNIALACPRCRNRIELTIWDAVDADSSSAVSQAIISGEFFRHRCPQCGARINLEMPLLYSDAARDLKICLLERGKDLREGLAKLDPTALGRVSDRSCTRLVHGNKDLSEKLSILQAGRDDRVIEVLKYLLLRDFRRQYPSESVADVRFACVNGAEKMVYYNSEGGKHAVDFDAALYTAWAEKLRPAFAEIDAQPYLEIDQSFAESVLYTYFGAQMSEAKAKGLSVLKLTDAAGKQNRKKSASKQKKGGKALLWVILALAALLIFSGVFVALKYNLPKPKAEVSQIGEVEVSDRSDLDISGLEVIGENDVIHFVPSTGD